VSIADCKLSEKVNSVTVNLFTWGF